MSRFQNQEVEDSTTKTAIWYNTEHEEIQIAESAPTLAEGTGEEIQKNPQDDVDSNQKGVG